MKLSAVEPSEKVSNLSETLMGGFVETASEDPNQKHDNAELFTTHAVRFDSGWAPGHRGGKHRRDRAGGN
jgi:hypothetical protein